LWNCIDGLPVETPQPLPLLTTERQHNTIAETDVVITSGSRADRLYRRCPSLWALN
jgi:hypothetical protein